jgi:uncharacterized membrane protein YhfC
LLQAVTVLAFIISLIVQVGYPLAAILYFRRRTGAPWPLFVYGALVFALFQLFTWLPLSAFLDVVWGETLKSAWGAFTWLMAMAFLTALIEETGRWVGYRFFFSRGNHRLTWRNGAAYALGHNALETMWLIAGLTFIGFVTYLIVGPMDPRSLLQQMGPEASVAEAALLQELAAVSWEQPLIVALERVLALPHQVAWALLVMESLASRQKRWFGFAVLYHTSIAIIVPGLARLSGFVVAEAVNLAFAVISIWIVARMFELSEQRA